MDIKKELDAKGGVFFVEVDGKRLAKMTFINAGPHKIIIDHTEVDQSLKGAGVGVQLVESAVGFAREHNLKILPLCPFAAAVFKKKAEDYKDVKA